MSGAHHRPTINRRVNSQTLPTSRQEGLLIVDTGVCDDVGTDAESIVIRGRSVVTYIDKSERSRSMGC